MRKTPKSPGEKIVNDIKRATRKHYSSEEKIRIFLDGLRGEDSRECLAIRVDRKLNSGNVIDALSDLFILRGVPSFIRSDRPGVHCSGRAGLDQGCGREDGLHRTRQPLGERLLRKLQCPVPRRVTER